MIQDMAGHWTKGGIVSKTEYNKDIEENFHKEQDKTQSKYHHTKSTPHTCRHRKLLDLRNQNVKSQISNC